MYKGLKEWPKDQRPPVAATFWSFRIMIALGLFFAVVSILAWFKRNQPEKRSLAPQVAGVFDSSPVPGFWNSVGRSPS